ncbi:hypothetical protein BO86DRAFT_72209 [Aspergillus japonicus CBS 114.51]|uniref:Uncharacterized protein n=1 Tax=Aspergillus japonicus CBS 114.51 TaxID=1448312 RepID=A0A8T8X3E1_ASPJA|nr:hypothetical protein BO86DRAFT_72209 [Aspergillus japonicus CBS 114.51]RAH82596.1 hypothetical protein BO86DRAFT_72209 [Aspergillus japonicus CBS 114.51]
MCHGRSVKMSSTLDSILRLSACRVGVGDWWGTGWLSWRDPVVFCSHNRAAQLVRSWKLMARQRFNDQLPGGILAEQIYDSDH